MFRIPFRNTDRKTDKNICNGLFTDRIFLRFPKVDDYQAWAQLRIESRSFLEPWEPKWPQKSLTSDYYKGLLTRYQEGRNHKNYYVFFTFERQSGNLIGGISLGNIRRGVVQSGQIGYWCAKKFSGLGYMYESLELMVSFAFHKLKLHRLEAASIPTNIRSIRLLERSGFSKEGLLRSYVKIDGRWQDHVLYALLETDQPLQAGESEAL